MTFFVRDDKGILHECESMEIKKGDLIKLKIGEDVDLDSASNIFEFLKEAYPDNQIIGLRDYELTTEESHQLIYEGWDEYWGPWDKCPVCGSSNRNYSKFCCECGVPIKGAEEPK